jgi:hypothetical protein
MKEGLREEWSVVGCVIPAATKGAPGGDAGEFPAVVFQLTIDDDVVDACRELIGLDVSGMVDDRGGIEMVMSAR